MADPASKLCYEWANDIGKQKKVEYFMVKKALAVFGSASGQGHAERIALASDIVDGVMTPRVYSMGITTLTTIRDLIFADTEPSDVQLETAVNDIFDKFAKID